MGSPNMVSVTSVVVVDADVDVVVVSGFRHWRGGSAAIGSVWVLHVEVWVAAALAYDTPGVGVASSASTRRRASGYEQPDFALTSQMRFSFFHVGHCEEETV